MNAPSDVSDKPRGLRAWWLRLWQEPDGTALAGASTMAASPAVSGLMVQAPTDKPSEAPPEPGRITKEALLSLRPAGPAQEEPLDLLQQRASFWATATHDLCQPAQALALFLERLRRLPPEASAEALHGYLQSSMQDLTRLLAGLMELAQIEAGEVQASRMVVSVDKLFFRVREQLADQAQAKGLRWVVRPNGRSVLGDAALLERVLLALGNNALRFCAQGTVLLSARLVQDGAAVRLDVSDSGPGIAERDHAKIFEPFAQRNVATLQEPSRPSLGLHIASHHCQLMGTQVQLRSALGRGSRFSITLPLADDRTKAHGADLPKALETFGLDGLRVALFDADDERAAMVAAWLRSWGCVLVDVQTLGAASALQAQAVVCAWQADAPLQAGQHIRALRAGIGSHIPACVIHADLGNAELVLDLPAATAVLGQALQAAQLRAWLRRVPRN